LRRHVRWQWATEHRIRIGSEDTKGGNGADMHLIIGLVVLVLDIIAILDCLKRPMETGKKALWIILIIVLPVVGMILYFLLGRGK
jgi:hypothetical protein